MITRIAKTLSLLLVIVLLAACQPAPTPSAPQPTTVPPTPTSAPTPAPIPEETMPAPEEPMPTPISGEEEGTRGTLPQSTPAAQEDMQDFDRPMALVDSAVLQVDGETGVASVVVTGNLADGCTELADVDQVFVDERLTINIYTSRDPDLMCTQALVPFETTIQIDAPISAQDLTSGRVPIFVNGVTMGQVE